MSQKLPKYLHSEIESKWQERWEKDRIYNVDIDKAKKPFYNLMMFPYPSAEGLHVGNMYAFTGADVYGRFKRMQGLGVFEPMGLDGFGIHAENYALKIDKHPMDYSKITEANFYRQLHATGNGFDWSRKVETYKPDYYKWTQWFFIKLFKAGLAYRKSSLVNWCPSCKTVLSDEQVIEGACERCGSIVAKRELEQWFFRITNYAERLLHNIPKLNWSEKVKISQEQWIGKSDGLLFTAPVKDSDIVLQTFSAHFEAFYADTFVVIAPDHPLLDSLISDVSNKKDIRDFTDKLINKRVKQGYVEEKSPEGIFTGKYIIDPVGNGDLPIWIASYAIKEYGTGIVKCSAHDERDFAFAQKYGIRLKLVLFPKDSALRKKVESLEICFSDIKNGYLSEPSEFAGKRAGDIREQIVNYAVEKGFAIPKVNYKIRDWLISRQRYWGPPIPMIHCLSCAKKGKGELNNTDWDSQGWYSVSENNLPVELPYIEDYRPLGTGKSPLASHDEFYKTVCPGCGSEARRETDVSDTFLDSSWYFFRYTSTDIENEIFDVKRVKKWLPVNMYIGGAEHSVLHLLYSRFITMFLFDQKLVSFEEPFSRFYAHGLLIKEGAKMSKSKGNVIIPDEYIAKFGADTLRTYLMFLGPYNQGGDFRDTGIEGMHRFLKRVWMLFSGSDNFSNEFDSSNKKMLHKTIKGVTDDIENLRYNTAISKLMVFYNFLVKQKKLYLEDAEVFLKLLAPFAPHITEEIFQTLPSEKLKAKSEKLESVHLQPWPQYDEKYLQEDFVTIVVQVNGKVRSTLQTQVVNRKSQIEIEKIAKENERVQKYLEGKEIKKVVYVEGKIINFVVD